MTAYLPDSTLILAGHGFDDEGPYLLIGDVQAKTQHRFPVWNRVFSMTKLPRRFCTGWFDLATSESHACDLGVELLPDSKDDDCPACREKTGFNPAFYNASAVSPQQRAYNLTPHYVYMAWFSPEHLKVGISSETRGIERLLEQGARCAAVIARFPNADEARSLEAHLCSLPGTFETMRASKKLELLCDVPYDPAAAAADLCAKAAKLGVDVAPDQVMDLSPFYFGGLAPDSATLSVPENAPEDVCGGWCIGMAGSALVFRTANPDGSVAADHPVSIKSWESHQIRIALDETLVEYGTQPQQMLLF